ncbi:hypothetical protein [Aggregatilinea lenta]|uniref:hypothetical protein n=1 Tax=Aggregatilinea lenta TaxID=913108 RepID=UPI000E5ACFE9|nr:hypothetical protein [Aggregatilinea lenta]
MANVQLNKALAQWTAEIAAPHMEIVEAEINKRMEPYPELELILNSSPMDVMRFYKLVQRTTVMIETSRYQSTSLGKFFADEQQARGQIRRFKRQIPTTYDALPEYFDTFVDRWARICELPKHSTSVLLSLVLTLAYPARFVDFGVQKWWVDFAQALSFGLPTAPGRRATPGVWIAWSGAFTQEIAETATFKKSWQRSEQERQYPMWVIAGLCWANKQVTVQAEQSVALPH